VIFRETLGVALTIVACFVVGLGIVTAWATICPAAPCNMTQKLRYV
jgi:hypothetical protein